MEERRRKSGGVRERAVERCGRGVAYDNATGGAGWSRSWLGFTAGPAETPIGSISGGTDGRKRLCRRAAAAQGGPCDGDGGSGGYGARRERRRGRECEPDQCGQRRGRWRLHLGCYRPLRAARAALARGTGARRARAHPRLPYPAPRPLAALSGLRLRNGRRGRPVRSGSGSPAARERRRFRCPAPPQ